MDIDETRVINRPGIIQSLGAWRGDDAEQETGTALISVSPDDILLHSNFRGT
jgi:hypothetical protein